MLEISNEHAFFNKWNVEIFALLKLKVSDYISAIAKLKLNILGCHLLVMYIW